MVEGKHQWSKVIRTGLGGAGLEPKKGELGLIRRRFILCSPLSMFNGR